VELLWPVVDPESGKRSLGVALSSLWQALENGTLERGAALRADRFAVQLAPEAVSIDVAEFEDELAAAAAVTDPAARAARLDRAVRLFSGDLPAGCYEEWIPREQRRLRHRLRAARRELVEIQERRGRTDQALAQLHALETCDPLDEEAARAEMRVLAAAGRRPEALRRYTRLAETCREELGADPSPETQALQLSLLREEDARCPPAPPPGATSPRWTSAAAPPAFPPCGPCSSAARRRRRG
jgi:DNA-binding SARP family transcriptional activator